MSSQYTIGQQLSDISHRVVPTDLLLGFNSGYEQDGGRAVLQVILLLTALKTESTRWVHLVSATYLRDPSCSRSRTSSCLTWSMWPEIVLSRVSRCVSQPWTYRSRMQETRRDSTSFSGMLSSLEMYGMRTQVYGLISLISTCVRMFLSRSRATP